MVTSRRILQRFSAILKAFGDRLAVVWNAMEELVATMIRLN
jgi:hypothetical protein